jgi:pimeloyl-ACP methyl ester carboxylesterase
MMTMRFLIALAVLASGLAATPLAAQAGARYETKFVAAGDIRLQYHDFGGAGLPVIFVQDFHDYFGAALDPSWPTFLARFADGFRVLAPVRRGWGESDDTGYGYDVATQAEDVLAFMDALGIQRAVLVGRTPADHDMTWIAEHHPERLAGLIYLQSLHGVADYGNPLIRAFTEAYSAGSCDMRDPVAQVGARTPWRPHFLRDESARIDVPALRFFWPRIDDRSMNLRRLERVAEIAASPSGCAQEKEREYFVALAADEAWQAELRQALLETDVQQVLDGAMQRAFGDDLRTIRSPDFDDYQTRLDFQYGHMRRFLEDVQRTRALDSVARTPAPSDWPADRSAVGVHTAHPDTAEVMAAAESFLTAFNNLEWDAFHASFVPSATVFHPFGEPWRNEDREEVAAFFGRLFAEVRSSSEGPPYLRITPQDLRIEMLAEAGIVTFHLPGQEAVGRRTLVFGRKEPTDPWRLFHLHASFLERPDSRDGRGATARDLGPEAARRYAGRYALQSGDGPRTTLVFRPAGGRLEAELGGQVRALRYLGGHTFQEVDSGFLFVFNVDQDGRAMGITGLASKLDRAEVFARLEDER